MPVVQPAELWQESGRWSAVRPRAAAHQGPARARLRGRPDARGSDHRHRAPRAEELPAAAGQLLPDPDEVPRRDAAALRRHARARVHHEGRVLLPRRRGLAARRATAAMYDAYTRIFTRTGPEVPRGAGRLGRDRRQMSRRNSTCSPTPARTRSCSPTATTTPPTSRLAAALPPTEPAPRCRARRCSKVATPGAKTIEDVARLPEDPAARAASRPCSSMAATTSVVALVLRGDHELNAVKAQKLPGVASPLRMASAAQRAGGQRHASRVTSAPVGLKCRGVCRSQRAARSRTSSAARTRRTCTSPASTGTATCPSPPAADLRNVVEGRSEPHRARAR